MFASPWCCADADEPNLRLRVEWGGPVAKSWRGSFSVSNGTLSEVRPLGLEADEPGSYVVTANTIPIRARSTRTYDGFDVLVRAPSDAVVRVQLSSDASAPPQAINIRLDELVSRSLNRALDDPQHRLVVQRAPGDRIRVKTDRDSVVFSPGELWRIDVIPHRVGLAPESKARLEVQLRATRGSYVIWRSQRDIDIDAQGGATAVAGLEIPLPETEGVYDIFLTLHRAGLRNPFGRAKPLVVRKLQVVVIGDRPPEVPSQSEPWQELAMFDPAQPKWWERLPRLPQWKLLPGVSPRPIGNEHRTITPAEGRSFTQLDIGGWQAYPLPIARTGAPHVLEVEYLTTVPQTLGISILETNEAGTVAPVGLDSGVNVSEASAESGGGTSWHRLVFWPRTKTPYVLVTNRRSDQTAAFGRLRVVAGPARLPPLAEEAPFDGVRMPLAHFDRPLFPEVFCARDALDARQNRGLDDWLTFYEGATRLAEYLKHVGYSGACISVYCEGSAIYPSRWLDATPKYDTGVYFSTGQDPMRKDILELLLRVFDREGLHLVPALQFTAPLPALEERLQRDESNREGIELVDLEGRRWVDRNTTQRGAAPYYNPLDPRVQAAMRDVVRELAQRYGHHRSMAGLSIDLSPDSYAILPAADWGGDRSTVERFRRETLGENHAPTAPSPAGYDDLLAAPHRKEWLNWRASKITGLYAMLHDELASVQPRAMLYLAGADLVDAAPIVEAMRPALPGRPAETELLKEMGIDAESYRDHPGIVLLRPYRLSPIDALVNHAIKLEFNESHDVDKIFSVGMQRGGMFYHETRTLRLPEFDQLSPFGKNNTHTWLAPRFSEAGAQNRRRFIRSLATLDAQVLFDGGWTVPMGQEESLRELLDTYRRLPRDLFQSPSQDNVTKQPLLVRTLVRDGQTYLYVMNDSPWPLSAEIELDAPPGCRVASLNPRRPPPPCVRAGKVVRWPLQLDAYDLRAAVITAPEVTVTGTSVELPGHVVPDLKTQIVKAVARVHLLQDPPTLHVVKDPGFEEVFPDATTPGWMVAHADGVWAGIDRGQGYQSQHSLRLESSGPRAWVRSEWFPVPETGRLLLEVQLRCNDAQRPPRLRLAIEGQLRGGTFRTSAAVTGSTPDEQLTTEWKLFNLPVTDLPVGRLERLRIGFDLIEPGTVWIDDVRLFDLPFTRLERTELELMVARWHHQWRHKRYGDCARSLNEYWPRFLRQYVPLPTQRMADASPPPSHETPPTTQPEKTKPSVLDRVKRLVPRVPRF